MLSLGKIDHIHIRVTDLAKAQAAGDARKVSECEQRIVVLHMHLVVVFRQACVRATCFFSALPNKCNLPLLPVQ